MKLSQKYLDSFETKQEIKDAIAMRLSVIRNKSIMPEVVEIGIGEEIEQFKFILFDKYGERYEWLDTILSK